jgi:hypothetical protein
MAVLPVGVSEIGLPHVARQYADDGRVLREEGS